MAVKNKVSAAAAQKALFINKVMLHDVIYECPVVKYILSSKVAVMPLEMVPNVRHLSLFFIIMPQRQYILQVKPRFQPKPFQNLVQNGHY